MDESRVRAIIQEMMDQTQYNVSSVPYHTHNGIDSPTLPSSSLIAPVTSVTGSGSGVSVSPTTGDIVIQNTGVTSLSAGTSISLSGSTGSITISSSATTPTLSFKKFSTATAVTVTNTTTETSLYSFTLTGGSLGTGNVLWCRTFVGGANGLSFANGSQQVDLRAYYGTQATLVTSLLPYTTGSPYFGYLDYYLYANGSANAQLPFFNTTLHHQGGANPGPVVGDNTTNADTFAQTSGSDQTVKFTVQWNQAQNTNFFTAVYTVGLLLS